MAGSSTRSGFLLGLIGGGVGGDRVGLCGGVGGLLQLGGGLAGSFGTLDFAGDGLAPDSFALTTLSICC